MEIKLLLMIQQRMKCSVNITVLYLGRSRKDKGELPFSLVKGDVFILYKDG